jgi:hypothetical protein
MQSFRLEKETVTRAGWVLRDLAINLTSPQIDSITVQFSLFGNFVHPIMIAARFCLQQKMQLLTSLFHGDERTEMGQSLYLLR